MERGGRENGRDYLTALLLPHVIGDQEWEEGREKWAENLTVLLLPQVVGD